MFEVDTLLVTSTSRGPYAVSDLINSMIWASPGRVYSIVVDEGTTELSQLRLNVGTDRYTLLPLPRHIPASWARGYALRYAHEQGYVYKQAMLLTDRCLITGQTIGDCMLKHTSRQELAVLGVRSRYQFIPEWDALRAWLTERGIPLEGWKTPPPSLVDDALFVAPHFAKAMRSRSILCPDNPPSRLPYATYLSWIAHIYNFYVVSIGFEDKVMPPLYINTCHGDYLPPPHILGDAFGLFAPCTQVLNYSESALREMYRYHRAETTTAPPKYAPIPTGPELKDG